MLFAPSHVTCTTFILISGRFNRARRPHLYLGRTQLFQPNQLQTVNKRLLLGKIHWTYPARLCFINNSISGLTDEPYRRLRIAFIFIRATWSQHISFLYTSSILAPESHINTFYTYLEVFPSVSFGFLCQSKFLSCYLRPFLFLDHLVGLFHDNHLGTATIRSLLVSGCA